MEAAWNILQLDHPDDFVIGTGEAVSVQQFLEEAFAQLGLSVKDHVVIDQKFFRPGKTSTLIADYAKAKKVFGYEPKIKYKELIKLMIDADMEEQKQLSGVDK
ncbi:MAG: GDPmannose 4,6-dehydratase [Candidatus Peregrinibacteria bacterium Greene1014_49]|nr:MAG: GDPmannose 4,6-dehydratase [Candidatus Peregrinibacteria bacterium Greene1014_49]